MTFSDLFRFEKFLTRTLIPILFAITSFILVLGYCGVVLSTCANDPGDGLIVAIVGGISTAITFLLLRLFAEAAIVIFNIHNELKEMNVRERNRDMEANYRRLSKSQSTSETAEENYL